MFTIDLLKGQGVPMRSSREGIAIAAVTFTVPVIIAMVLLGLYMSDGIAMLTRQREIVNCKKRISALSDAMELQKSFEKDKNIASSSLSEVKSSIGRHTQWSPVLRALVKNLPDSLVLTKLEVKQRSVKIKVPQEGDPKQTVDITVPVRTLRMSVRGRPHSACDKAVRDFRDRLRFSTLLGPRIDGDIKVSQKSSNLEGRDVVSYEMDCVFKPGL